METETPPPNHEHELEHRREHELALEQVERKTLLRGLLAGGFTAAAFGLGGFLLLRDNTGAMGGVLFLLLPLASGFATALVARRRNILIASLIVGVLICAAVLLATGKEGLLCVLMAAPLLGVGLALGAVAGYLFRRFVLNRFRNPGILSLLVLLVAPLFLVGANSAEEPSRRTPRTETIINALVVDASPETAWKVIKSMDSVHASKPLLMKLGLPVPTSCVLQKEAVGGKRTCYFDSGYIEETITEWDPPSSMKVAITATNLPGIHWLTFKEASYEIKKENGRTVITRSTTIVSRLSPAWYWQRLESLGVETEHEYLFEQVRNEIGGVR